MMSTALVTRQQGTGNHRAHHRLHAVPQQQQKQLLLQMVQGQLDDSTEFGDLLDLQEQIRALQQELAEVKQADDEEIEKLLDQNAELQVSAAEAQSAQEQAIQAVKAAGQRVAQLETANAELRASNRQLVQQAEDSSGRHASQIQEHQEAAAATKKAAVAAQAELKKVQASAEQAASKLSLAEMQMVELRAQRLEGLQAADTVKQQASQLASSKVQLQETVAAQAMAAQDSRLQKTKVAQLQSSVKSLQARCEQATQVSKQHAEQSRKAAQDAETASTHLQDSMQLQAAKQLQAQAEQASQKAAEQQHKLQTSQAQVQELQTLVQSQQNELKGTQDLLSRNIRQAKAQAIHMHRKLQVANAQVSDLQTGRAVAEASHHAELTQLRDEVEAAHQQLQTQQEVSLRLQTQHGPESSALVLVQPTPSAGQQGNRAELGQDVAALQGWLQRVAPQLDELAGLKQQMGRLISVLQPGTGVQRQEQAPVQSTAPAQPAQLQLQSASPLDPTTAQPTLPSAMARMADAPDPFWALITAEPSSAAKPMFSGLNAIVNPFRWPPLSPPRPQADGATAGTSGPPSYASNPFAAPALANAAPNSSSQMASTAAGSRAPPSASAAPLSLAAPALIAGEPATAVPDISSQQTMASAAAGGRASASASDVPLLLAAPALVAAEPATAAAISPSQQASAAAGPGGPSVSVLDVPNPLAAPSLIGARHSIAAAAGVSQQPSVLAATDSFIPGSSTPTPTPILAPPPVTSAVASPVAGQDRAAAPRGTGAVTHSNSSIPLSIVPAAATGPATAQAASHISNPPQTETATAAALPSSAGAGAANLSSAAVTASVPTTAAPTTAADNIPLTSITAAVPAAADPLPASKVAGVPAASQVPASTAAAVPAVPASLPPAPTTVSVPAVIPRQPQAPTTGAVPAAAAILPPELTTVVKPAATTSLLQATATAAVPAARAAAILPPASTTTAAPAAAAAVGIRPASKRKWDVMAQPQPAAAAPYAAASGLAAGGLPPPPASEEQGTMTGTQAAASCSGTGAVQLPIPGPPLAGQAAKGIGQTAATLPASQLPSAGELAQPAASKALVGKDLAAKLAADFAQQHRSRQSAVAAVVGSQTAVAGAAAMGTQAAAAVDVSAAIQAAAAAAAEKVLQDRAARAKAAAEKHIHEQVLRAKQSVQSSGDVHAARMEAIRLRNAARHGSPQAPAVLPAAVDQAAATAVVPEPQLPAQGAAPHHLAKSQHPESMSDDNSRSRKKRGRDEDCIAPVEYGTELDLPGPPAHRVADLSTRRRSRRSNSPASAGSRDSLRRQNRDYSSESRQARRWAEQQAPKVTTNYPQDGTLSPSRLSSRSGGGSLPTASDRSLGHSPSRKGGHTGRGQPSSKQASSPERQEQAGTQRHPDGQSKAPERLSAHRDTPEQGAQLASPRHHRGRRGGPRSSPRGRAIARRHSRSQRQSPSQHTSPVERGRLDSTPSQNQAAPAQGGKARGDSGDSAQRQPAHQPQPQPLLATAKSASGSLAASQPGVQGGAEGEEAEEGELEPGERAAGWDSGPEEETAGRSASEPAGPEGSSMDISQADSLKKKPAEIAASLQRPASTLKSGPQGSKPDQVRDPLPAPQSGYHSSGTPAAAPPPAPGTHPPQPAHPVKPPRATSGGSQSTVSQSSVPHDSCQPASANGQPAHKRSKLANQSDTGKATPGAAKLHASTVLQSAGSTGTAPVRAAVAKGVTKQTVAATEVGQKVGGVSTPAPAPPPGSPTASSKTQEVVPPPPPAVTPPSSLLSPTSSRTPPAATTSPVPVSQLQPRKANPPSPAPTAPLNHVKQQQLQHQRSPQLQRPQQQQQKLLPAKSNPAPAGAAVAGVKLGIKGAPGSGAAQQAQQAHVTHMEQQHPPQVQLPAYAAPRQQQKQQQRQQQQQQQHHQQQQQQQQRSIAQQHQGVPQQKVVHPDGPQQGFRQGQALAMYQGQHDPMLQPQQPHQGQMHPGHPLAAPIHPAQMPQWLHDQSNPPHMRPLAPGPGPTGAQGIPGLHAQYMQPAHQQNGPSSFAQAHFGFQQQPFQPGVLNASRQAVPSNMQPGWFTPTFMQ